MFTSLFILFFAVGGCLSGGAAEGPLDKSDPGGVGGIDNGGEYKLYSFPGTGNI